MLKQILEQMYIDPELLELLSEDDKQLLYRKMREEQIRKWKLREEKIEVQERRHPPKKTPRKVKIMLGADKQPWVWVMGEGPGDLPYEELVKKREQEELEKQRRQELEDRRKAEELAMIESQALLIDPILNINNNNHNSVDKEVSTEQRDTLSPLPSVNKRLSIEDIEVLQKQRTEELFASFKETRRRARKRSEQMDLTVEQVWEDQEKKAKTFERQRKESFIKARERLKSDSYLPEMMLERLPDEKKVHIREKMTRRTLSSGAISRYHYAPKHLPRVKLFTNNPNNTRPSCRDAVVKWFKNIEKPKGVGLEMDGTVSEWMHGIINRADADELLRDMPMGSFLIRVSVRIWGYTVSVKCRLGIQHFMIESYKDHYQFSGGDNMTKFSSLKGLLDYHQTTPISQAGRELLEIPCGQMNNEMPDYKELYEACSDDEDSDSGTVL